METKKMAIPGINFFNEGENSIKLNNTGAPQFINTIFGAEPAGGAMGVDAFEAAEPKEAPSGVDASEPAEPAEAPRRTTKKNTNKTDANYKKVYNVALNQAIRRIRTKKGGFAKKIEELGEHYTK